MNLLNRLALSLSSKYCNCCKKKVFAIVGGQAITTHSQVACIHHVLSHPSKVRNFFKSISKAPKLLHLEASTFHQVVQATHSPSKEIVAWPLVVWGDERSTQHQGATYFEQCIQISDAHRWTLKVLKDLVRNNNIHCIHCLLDALRCLWRWLVQVHLNICSAVKEVHNESLSTDISKAISQEVTVSCFCATQGSIRCLCVMCFGYLSSSVLVPFLNKRTRSGTFRPHRLIT
mmetsp:Transcript_68989/g.125879  ORF Transcript_68989/g.125879 Transcript_68989/m.125879 type:complete len:231 (+) Transcript_68989:126-818(+)